MLIKKGGISRNIDENHLHAYTAKGYCPVEEVSEEAVPNTEPPAGGGEKPVERMNTAELTQKAMDLGVDISAATNNKQRAEAILAHIAELAKE